MPDLISLDLIDPNPFQLRLDEDPEHVARLTQSIADQGLLQIPLGRRVGGRVQLAFGHTRLAAFKSLHQQGTKGFHVLPVELRSLSNEEMFTLAVGENMARKDLNPIETARTMLTFRQHFYKTSAEIGRLFGLSESAVRNKLRLLDLPEAVQQQVGSQLTEGQARDLLTMQRIAPPEHVAEVADWLAKDPTSSSSEIVSEALDKSEQAIRMWARWQKDEEPRGGLDLWPLSWTPADLDSPTLAAFEKFYTAGQVDNKTYGEALFYIRNPDIQVDPHNQLMPKAPPEGVLDAMRHLVHPPACTACPYYSRLNFNHYCGSRICWERKRSAWAASKLSELSASLSIPVYDPKKDGKVFEVHNWNNRDLFKKWISQKADFLRLQIHFSQFQNDFTKSFLVRVISVGEESIKKLKADKALKREEKNIEGQLMALERQRLSDQQVDLFIKGAAAPVFAEAFRPLKAGVVHSLLEGLYYVREENEKRPPAKRLAEAMLNDHLIPYSVCKLGLTAVAKHLQGVAKAWGIVLPQDWLTIAESYANASESVSVETLKFT